MPGAGSTPGGRCDCEPPPHRAKTAWHRRPSPPKIDAAAAGSVSPRKAAGISDEAVRTRTGKGWEDWFRALDRRGASARDHRGIVALVEKIHPAGGWWEQMIAVAYEQERGLREKHRKPGGFQVGASRTLAVPADRAWRAFAEAALRRRWLPGGKLDVTTSTPGRSIRGQWGRDEGRLDVNFTARGTGRCQVAVQHGRIADARTAEEMKSFWRERLGALSAVLAKPSPPGPAPSRRARSGTRRGR